MSTENERRFLVYKDKLPDLNSLPKKYIEQFYLFVVKFLQIRIRIIDKIQAIPGIKTKKKKGRIRRKEHEIVLRFGCDWIRKQLLASRFLRIYKTRYDCFFRGKKWEIDVYHGDNEGVIVTEIELPTEDSPIGMKPPWVGREITHEARYGNADLARNPFRTWPENTRK